MILLLALLSLSAALEPLPPIASALPLSIVCQDQDDLFGLLYSICITDPVCARLYSLDRHGVQHRRDLFYHQMTLFSIFGPAPDPGGVWLEGRWPANVTVSYNPGGDSCYNLTTLNPTEQSLFNYVTLDRLKTHKQYYSRLVCPHLNERLLYDAETGKFNCICLDDKRCDDSSWHDMVVTILAGLVLGLFVITFIVVLILGPRLLVAMKKLMPSSLEKTTPKGGGNKQD